jgi:hypothetical protein
MRLGNDAAEQSAQQEAANYFSTDAIVKFLVVPGILLCSLIPQFAVWSTDDIFTVTLPDPDGFGSMVFMHTTGNVPLFVETRLTAVAR